MKDVFGVVADQVLAALNSSSDLHEFRVNEDFFKKEMKEAVAANETPAMVLDNWVKSVGAVQDRLKHMPQPKSYDTNYDKLKKKYSAHKSVDVRENPDRYAEYHPALVEIVGRRLMRAEESQVPEGAVTAMSGIWEQVSDLLTSLEKILPQAIDILKAGRTEVSAVSATLDSIFSTLEEKGAPIFGEVALAWQFLWIFYFFLVMPITAGILFYGFW